LVTLGRSLQTAGVQAVDGGARELHVGVLLARVLPCGVRTGLGTAFPLHPPLWAAVGVRGSEIARCVGWSKGVTTDERCDARVCSWRRER
jgi:hypothetical protein